LLVQTQQDAAWVLYRASPSWWEARRDACRFRAFFYVPASGFLRCSRIFPDRSLGVGVFPTLFVLVPFPLPSKFPSPPPRSFLEDSCLGRPLAGSHLYVPLPSLFAKSSLAKWYPPRRPAGSVQHPQLFTLFFPLFQPVWFSSRLAAQCPLFSRACSVFWPSFVHGVSRANLPRGTA